MNIWVPGSNGLVGSMFCMLYPAIGSGRELDIGDLEAVRTFVKTHPTITHIVNCAALSQVDSAEVHREAAHRANALGPENLGKAAKEFGLRLVHLSTDYVFSGEGRKPLKEEDPTGPVNYYGETKLEGEKRLMAVFPRACVLRTSWVFGNGGKNFVARLLQMLREKEEIHLSDDQWSRPTYVKDLVQAIFKMLDCSGIYHYANRNAATKFAFGVEMQKYLQFAASKKLIAAPSASFPSPCRRPVYSVFDTSKIEKLMSIRSWQDALLEFCEGT